LENDEDELSLDGIDVLDASFFDIIQPGILEFEKVLLEELGADLTFECVSLD